jgi:hypothetical protein
VLVRVINFGLAGADGQENVDIKINHFTNDLAYDPGATSSSLR